MVSQKFMRDSYTTAYQSLQTKSSESSYQLIKNLTALVMC